MNLFKKHILLSLSFLVLFMFCLPISINAQTCNDLDLSLIPQIPLGRKDGQRVSPVNNTIHGSSVVSGIKYTYGSDWCSSSKLCPANTLVKDSNGNLSCGVVGQTLGDRWADIQNGLGGIDYFDYDDLFSSSGNIYYENELCQICQSVPSAIKQQGGSGSGGSCGTPTFSEKQHETSLGGMNTKDNGTLASLIVNRNGSNWCSSSELCPSGVVSGSTCGAVSDELKAKWDHIIGGAYTGSFFETGDKYYYNWKLCSMCKNANPTSSDGSGKSSTPSDPAGGGGGSQPPAATPGVPTSVTIGGFEKLDNPLGPANLTTVSDVIERALGIIIKISIPFVVLMLIWTGFQFVIAQGNATKISAAKNTLLWVIVGAAILIGCVAIANAIAKSVECVASVAGGAECK